MSFILQFFFIEVFPYINNYRYSGCGMLNSENGDECIKINFYGHDLKYESCEENKCYVDQLKFFFRLLLI